MVWSGVGIEGRSGWERLSGMGWGKVGRGGEAGQSRVEMKWGGQGRAGGDGSGRASDTGEIGQVGWGGTGQRGISLDGVE